MHKVQAPAKYIKSLSIKKILPIILIGTLTVLLGCSKSDTIKERAIKTKSNTANTRASGISAYKKGKWDLAIKKLKQAIDENPKDNNARFQLARSYENKKMLNDAMRQYQSLITIDKNNADAHYNLGRIYIKKNQTDKAIQEFEKAIANNKNFTSARVDLADAYTKTKDYAKALATYDELIKTFKADTKYSSHIHTLKGNIYRAMGDTTKAKAEYEAAVKLNNDNEKAVDALQKMSKS